MIPKFQFRRQKIAYILTLSASIGLISTYFYLQSQSAWSWKSLWSALITWLPLLYFLPRLIRRDLKAYQITALWSAWHFFIGGLMVLWLNYPAALWGWWVMFCAILLMLGSILHNFKKRIKKNLKTDWE